jgi:hypothetical protein
MAVFQLPFENRQPEPGEVGFIRLIDLEGGTNQVIAETCGWEPQLGANINWGATDHELFFNDVDMDTWKPFAWKLDPLSSKKEKMEGSVYHASSDGKWLISSNLSLLRKTQDGYGVAVPTEIMRSNNWPIKDEGFYITDTITGKRRMLISIHDLFTKADPPVHHKNIENCEIYGFHCKFNPQGTRLMLSLRWYPKSDDRTRNYMGTNYKDTRFAWFTLPLKGDAVHCAIGPEQFLKGGHHASWFPDGEHISLNLRIDGWQMAFVMVKYDGSNLHRILYDVSGSGHPTVHPCGYILTDTYLASWDYEPSTDGTVPLRWINIKNGKEKVIIRIPVNQPYNDAALRVDPHPAWDRSWRYITFNGFVNGSRRVFLGDMTKLLDNGILNAALIYPHQSIKQRTKKHLKRAKIVARRILNWNSKC